MAKGFQTLHYSDAGTKKFNNYSGTAGGDTQIHLGPGRLMSVLPHAAISGVAVTFYDGAAAVSGGPLSASGHHVVGVVPANTNGQATQSLAGPTLIRFDIPFTSGLCVTGASGAAGFTATYTVASG